MPVSIPAVFFCASVSSGLCRAAVWIFCWAIWYTCCWLFGLPEKKLPMRLNSPCCWAYTYDWLTFSTAGSSCGLGSVTVTRSEEHTSELQSQFHLVCRLLLEKKKL